MQFSPKEVPKPVLVSTSQTQYHALLAWSGDFDAEIPPFQRLFRLNS